MDNYVRTAKVLRVVDGDTIDLTVDLGFDVWKKERIRLARVDAPEVRGVEREAGLAAKKFVVDLLEMYPVVIVKTTKARGKYGRYIGEIEFEEIEGKRVINLSDTLLAEGHAEEYKE